MKDIVNQIYKSNEEYFINLAKSAIAMDLGIATMDNLVYLKQHNYSYFIIERRNVSKLYKEEFSDIKETGISYETKSKQTIYLKKIEEENYTRVLVYSLRKMKKRMALLAG